MCTSSRKKVEQPMPELRQGGIILYPNNPDNGVMISGWLGVKDIQGQNRVRTIHGDDRWFYGHGKLASKFQLGLQTIKATEPILGLPVITSHLYGFSGNLQQIAEIIWISLQNKLFFQGILGLKSNPLNSKLSPYLDPISTTEHLDLGIYTQEQEIATYIVSMYKNISSLTNVKPRPKSHLPQNR